MMMIITLAALVYLMNNIRLPWWCWAAILLSLISPFLGYSFLAIAGTILALGFLIKLFSRLFCAGVSVLERALSSPKLDFMDGPAQSLDRLAGIVNLAFTKPLWNNPLSKRYQRPLPPPKFGRCSRSYPQP